MLFFNEFLGKNEAEAGACLVAGTCSCYMLINTEQFAEAFSADPDAIVLHTDFDHFTLTATTYFHLSVLTREFYSIAHQVP